MSRSYTFDILLLPQEIYTQILCLLPVKSLGLCKCVSKPWRSIISQPEFVKAHLSKQTHHHPKLILVSHEGHPITLMGNKIYSSSEFFGTIYSVEFDFNIDANPFAFCRKLNFQYPHKWLHVLGSCNGLLLVEDHERSMFLLNPTTLEAKKLQVSPFHALTPGSFYGLGFDACTDDYKVVSVPLSHNFMCDRTDQFGPILSSLFIDVYTLKRDNWRRVQICPCDYYLTDDDSGVQVNGSLHSLARKKSDGLYTIAAFDLAGEGFLEVRPPVGVDNYELRHHRVVVLGGCLCLVVDVGESFDVNRTDVWMMEEYGAGDSWTKFTIRCRSNSWPSCFFGDKKALLDDWDRKFALNWKIGGEKKLVVYNFEDQTSTAMEGLEIPSSFDVSLTFVDSLVSPNNHYGRSSSSYFCGL